MTHIGHLIKRYCLFNPHATFGVKFLDKSGGITDTNKGWEKWLPSYKTSPHWYTIDRLRSLIGGHLQAEQQGARPLTVREFISTFHGLAATAKQKQASENAGLSGKYLRDLLDLLLYKVD